MSCDREPLEVVTLQHYYYEEVMGFLGYVCAGAEAG